MHKRIKKEYIVTMELQSPLHIGAGIDSGQYRTMLMLAGQPFIPASTVKGKMRDNFAKLIETGCDKYEDSGQNCTCPVCTLFGKAGYQPANIYIDDFTCTNEKRFNLSTRHMTSIDRYRRVTKDGALTSVQIVEKCMFQGIVKIYFSEKTLKYQQKLKLSLKMIEAVGNGKSRGRGFVKVEVRENG